MYNKNRRAKYGYLFVQWGKVNEKARKRESEEARKRGSLVRVLVCSDVDQKSKQKSSHLQYRLERSIRL